MARTASRPASASVEKGQWTKIEYVAARGPQNAQAVYARASPDFAATYSRAPSAPPALLGRRGTQANAPPPGLTECCAVRHRNKPPANPRHVGSSRLPIPAQALT